jgi:tRNA (cmo5U34)-methyltransferase
MFEAASRNLQHYGDRVRLVREDVTDFVPRAGFDAIFSNLVLHNVDPDGKRRLLSTFHEWLEPGGVFVWGDLIRHNDEAVERNFVEYRKEFALAAGCPPELVRLNFAKESREDHPLTVECTLEATESAGFAQVDLVWAHDTFAVVVAGKRE